MPALLSQLPADITKRRYIEPFLGAGSLFFAVKPKRAILGDANKALIATYRAIRDDAPCVRHHLSRLVNSHSAASYYVVRDAYNKGTFSPEQAARFLYLNKACFNGIFRVNLKGEFNVPKGSKDKLVIPEEAAFSSLASVLRKATFRPWPYQTTLKWAKAEDFVYLDPPYPALNGTAYFTHYTADRFDDKAQETLAAEVWNLHNRGIPFLMSNADVKVVRGLYSAFTITPVDVRRFISCKTDRVQVSELLIKNY